MSFRGKFWCGYILLVVLGCLLLCACTSTALTCKPSVDVGKVYWEGEVSVWMSNAFDSATGTMSCKYSF